MAGRYKAYPEYKESGITWTGKVPSHWTLVRFKHVFAEKKKASNATLPSGSISFGEVIYKSDEAISPETKASYQEVLKGEFLVNPLNMNYDLLSLRTALSSINVVVSTGYIVLRSNSRINKRYARWLLQEFDVAHMKTLGSGVRQTINYTDIGNSFFFEVPEAEQKQIAKFLDHETAKIDLLIAKQQALIALLKEKRQAVISHAVTKGLNPNAKMKDSGVEWLGQVPEHWKVLGLGKVIVFMCNGSSATQIEQAAGLVPVTRIETISGGSFNYERVGYVREREVAERHLLKPGDIQFSNINSLSMVGNCAMYEKCDVLYAGMNLLHIRPDPDLVRPRYMHYQFKTKLFRNCVEASAKPAINQASIPTGTLRAFDFVCPPIDEQTQITEFLDLEMVKLDALGLKAEAAIELMQERRTALISAAVTGKIDVRDWEPASEAEGNLKSAV